MFRLKAKHLVVVAIVGLALVLSASQTQACGWGGCGWGGYGWGAYGWNCCEPWGGYFGWYGGCGWGCGRMVALRRACYPRYSCWGCGDCCTGCWPYVDSCCDVGCCGATEGTPVMSSPAPAPTMAPKPAPPKPEVSPTPAMPPAPAPNPPAPGKAAAPAGASTNFFPSRATSGLLTVYVPADATVIINGRTTESTGSKREYVSYNLQPGLTYKYTVTAQIQRGGKMLEDTKEVTITAGSSDGVAFGFNAKPDAQLAQTF